MDGSCFVYVLVSRKRPYVYAGLTYDVERRIAQHNAGRNRSTAPYRPFDLLLVEVYTSRAQARGREKFFKMGQGRLFIHELRVARYGPSGYPILECDI